MKPQPGVGYIPEFCVKSYIAEMGISVTRQQVITQARLWLRTPWQHQQGMRGVACDCRGLIIGVARELGVVPVSFDVTGYGRLPDGTLLDVCAAYMRQIPKFEMAPGDVVCVAVRSDPQHLGIVTNHINGGLGIIHASSGPIAEVIETRLEFQRAMVFQAAYVFPGVS